jgi:large subunit ribosomal protein L4
VHQIVVAYQANARQRQPRAPRAAAKCQALDEEALAPEGHRPRPRRHDLVSPLWRGGGRISRSSARRELLAQKINKKMYRAGMASILSQLAREGRLAVVDDLTRRGARRRKLLAQQVQGDGPGLACW